MDVYLLALMKTKAVQSVLMRNVHQFRWSIQAYGENEFPFNFYTYSTYRLIIVRLNCDGRTNVSFISVAAIAAKAETGSHFDFHLEVESAKTRVMMNVLERKGWAK